MPSEILLRDSNFIPSGQLSEDGKNLVKTWRVQAYIRDPLPDAFDTYFFRNYVINGPSLFDDLLTSHAKDVADVFVYIYPNKTEVELYFVSFTVLVAGDISQATFDEIKRKSKLMLDEIHKLDGIQVLQIDSSGFSSEDVPTTELLVARPEDFTMLDATSMNKLRLHSYCGPDDWNG